MPSDDWHPQDCLQYIRDYIIANGYPPSVREIGKAFEVESSSTVATMLNYLKDKGYLRWTPTKPRTLKVVQVPTEANETEVELVVKIRTTGRKSEGVPDELRRVMRHFWFDQDFDIEVAS